MKKIVIFDTAIGSSNNGDEIILDSIYNYMAQIFNQGYSSRLATHINNFGLLQILRNGLKVKYYKDADWKFICGTNLIQQKRIGKVSPQWIISLSNIPVLKGSILIGAGATDSSTRLDFLAEFLYKQVLSKKYIHSVRDEQTKMLLESIGLQAVNTGCPTLWGLTENFCSNIPKNKASKCVISVSGYIDQLDVKQDQKMVDIIKSNYSDVWVWIQTMEDAKYLSTLSGTDNLKKIYSLYEYSKILNNGDIDYVGTRLHGGVFALQHKCRSIVISIDHRAKQFHESNNLPIVERNNIDKELENMINTPFSTEVKLRRKEIKKFMDQFLL